MPGKTNIIYLIALGVLMAMCTAQRPGTRIVPMRDPPIEPSMTMPPTVVDMGYGGALEPVFYYTEGLKVSQVRGDHVGAARLFDKAIETDSTHSPSYYAAANNIAMLDPELALRYSRWANDLESDNEWYRMQLARLLVMNGRYPDAQAEYRELLRTSPNNPENYRMLAALYEATRQPFAAVALLDSAETRFGRMEELTSMKREMYIKLNMFDEAIEESLGMAAEYPYDYSNYMIVGDLYLVGGRDSLAWANLEKAAALNPDGLDVLASLANYYRKAGNSPDLFATLKKMFRTKDMDVGTKSSMLREMMADEEFFRRNYFAVSDLALTLRGEYPGDYGVLELYGQTLFAGGQTEEGMNLYKNYITDTTSFVEPFVFILEGEAFLSRLDSVNKYSRMAIERFPDNPDLYFRRGSALLYMERPRDAIDIYEQALRVTTTDSVRAAAYQLIGDAWHDMGNDRRAFANYEKTLKLDPNNILALNNYAYFLSLTGRDLDRALKMAARVMELEPGNGTYIDTYGWVLYKMGRLEEAKKALQQAVSLNRTESAEVLVHYGDVLYELGEDYMARYYWDKALKAGYDEKEIEARMQKPAKK